MTRLWENSIGQDRPFVVLEMIKWQEPPLISELEERTQNTHSNYGNSQKLKCDEKNTCIVIALLFGLQLTTCTHRRSGEKCPGISSGRWNQNPIPCTWLGVFCCWTFCLRFLWGTTVENVRLQATPSADQHWGAHLGLATFHQCSSFDTLFHPLYFGIWPPNFKLIEPSLPIGLNL